MPRYSVDLTPEEVKQVQAIAKKEDRTLASALRCMIRRQLQVVILLENRVNCLESAHNPQSPSHGQDLEQDTRSSTPEKKEEKDNKKKKDPTLAPLNVTGRILSDLNERAGTNFQASGKVARRLIAARLNDGFTEADFIEVNRKKCIEWKDDPKMAHHLTHETLYGPKFEKYLGQLEGRSGQQSFNPDNQGNQQNYTDGVDENGRW